MPFFLTRRFFLGSIGAAASALLTGCYTAPQKAKPKRVMPAFTNIGPRSLPATPEDTPALPVTTLEALKNDGVFYFDDNRGAQFRITGPDKRKNTFRVIERFERNTPHGFSWGTGAVAVMKNSARIPPEKPTSLRVESDGHVIISFAEHKGLELHVSLEAYDVSGKEIRNYLRNRTNMPTNAALFMGKDLFPAGSVAYAATLWVANDEILTPSRTAFTGSETIEDFSKRYMKETPICMRSLPGRDVSPIGLLFKAPITAKKVRRRYSWVEARQTGKVGIYPTKRGTIFCEKLSPDPIGQAEWTLAYVNGTRTISIEIPDSIDPLSFGMTNANKHCLIPAFSEERRGSGRRRKRQVIPTYLWKKDCKIRDAQFRFNITAAKAIDDAIKASQPLREDWEHENENEVAKRAEAIKARKASGKARRI